MSINELKDTIVKMNAVIKEIIDKNIEQEEQIANLQSQITLNSQKIETLNAVNAAQNEAIQEIINKISTLS